MSYPTNTLCQTLTIPLFAFLFSANSSAELIGHWPFDGDARDHIGNRHGRLVASEFSDDSLIGSHSVQFGSRAKNRSVMLGNFDPSNNELSISMWIKPHHDGNGHQILMAKRQGWAKEKLRWQFVWQDIHPPKKPIPGEPYALTKEVLRLESWHDSRAEFPCKIQPDEWTHLVVTHAEATGITRCFINGEEVKTGPQKMSFGPAKEAPVAIGGTHPDDWREIFHGNIDDVRLWNEVVTADQVKAIYDSARDEQLRPDASKTSMSSSDWPQWLGPGRDAVWRDEGIVHSFPEAGPPLRWKSAIGGGYGGPAVAGGRVFVMDRVQAGEIHKADLGAYTRKSIPGKERVVCLNESTGEIIWTHSYDCPYTIATNYANGPRVTPTVDGGLVYALGAEGHLHCLNVETGEVVWSRDFKNDFGLEVPVWGIASHPLIDGNKLICVAGGKDGVAVALDKQTGKLIWRALPAKEPGYAPAMLYEIDGERHLIIWHSDAICSVDPETGTEFWSVEIEPFAAMSIAAPRIVGHDVFIMSHRRQCWMIKIADDRRSAEVVWEGDPKTGIGGVQNTPFVEDGLIYGCDLDGAYTCARLSNGERLWTSYEPLVATRRVSWGNVFTIKHNDRFFLATDTGDLIIAKLTGDGYQELSRAHLIEPNQRIGSRKLVWSHPAFANRCVYLRNDGEIRCYSLSEDRISQ